MSSSSSSSDSSSSEAESSARAAQRAQKRKRPSADDSSSDSDAAEQSDDDSSSSSDAEAAAPADDDAPVLSHAELRRQKKKQQKTASAPADAASPAKTSQKPQKVKNTAELAPSKVPRRQNSVWVGNLSFKTTPDALRRFFDGVGEITRVHMPMKMASGGPGARGAVKENRGFAYIDFATPEAKTIAVTLSENPLDGRKLLIKDGDDFAGRPAISAAPAAEGADAKLNSTGHTKTAQKILRSQKQPAGPTLFLGNLGFETTEDAIRDLFTQHRELKVVAEEGGEKEGKPDKWIRKIRMGTFEDSGKCKGWAFVDFTTTEHATAALTNPKNHFLGGRKLVVEYASPEAVRRGGAGPRAKKTDANPDGTEKPRRERVRPKRARDDDEGEQEPTSPAKKQRTEDAGEEQAQRRERRHGREERERTKTRVKPGAALAAAKRETVGIVPGQGKKIVF